MVKDRKKLNTFWTQRYSVRKRVRSVCEAAGYVSEVMNKSLPRLSRDPNPQPKGEKHAPKIYLPFRT